MTIIEADLFIITGVSISLLIMHNYAFLCVIFLYF